MSEGERVGRWKIIFTVVYPVISGAHSPSERGELVDQASEQRQVRAITSNTHTEERVFLIVCI